MLGGVAAGIADYFNIDPVLVRIGFVVLTFLGGSGILLYAAGWLLMPSDESSKGHVPGSYHVPPSRRRRRGMLAIVIAGLLLAFLLSHLFAWTLWWPGGPGPRGRNIAFGLSLGLFAAIVVLAIALAALVGRRVVRFLLLVLAAALVLTVGTLWSLLAMSGVPFHGGIGSAQWEPASASQLKPGYHLAMGSMIVDLRRMQLPPSGAAHVTATVGMGRLLIEVPPTVTVSVIARSGLGNVSVFGIDDGGFDASQSLVSPLGSDIANPTQGRLFVDAQAGIGQVEIVRAA